MLLVGKEIIQDVSVFVIYLELAYKNGEGVAVVDIDVECTLFLLNGHFAHLAFPIPL